MNHRFSSYWLAHANLEWPSSSTYVAVKNMYYGLANYPPDNLAYSNWSHSWAFVERIKRQAGIAKMVDGSM